MRLFKGIAPISEWLNTPEECHAFWSGLMQSFHWRKHDKVDDSLAHELHYFDTGMAIGDIAKTYGIILAGIRIWRKIKGGG